MKELNEELKKALKTGKILLGSRKVTKALLAGNLKLVILSQTCPIKIAERIKYYCTLEGVPQVNLDKKSGELGAAGGKPFSVSAIGIIKEGESKILDFVKKG